MAANSQYSSSVFIREIGGFNSRLQASKAFVSATADLAAFRFSLRYFAV